MHFFCRSFPAKDGNWALPIQSNLSVLFIRHRKENGFSGGDWQAHWFGIRRIGPQIRQVNGSMRVWNGTDQSGGSRWVINDYEVCLKERFLLATCVISGNTWRCPDPGCKRENQKSDQACTQCSLPSQSAQQFKKGERAKKVPLGNPILETHECNNVQYNQCLFLGHLPGQIGLALTFFLIERCKLLKQLWEHAQTELLFQSKRLSSNSPLASIKSRWRGHLVGVSSLPW